jgi:YggT family protein|tara:strand:- start:36097 stop:36390 length:294 start_codon:yes stop_codon:yes gene_type:complete
MVNLINAFINLANSALGIYQFFLICYIVMHYLFLFKIVNPHNQFVNQIYGFLIKIFEPVLKKIRNYIPNINGIDLSIIALFLLIAFTQQILTGFYVR